MFFTRFSFIKELTQMRLAADIKTVGVMKLLIPVPQASVSVNLHSLHSREKPV